jgi:hypothetical protein
MEYSQVENHNFRCLHAKLQQEMVMMYFVLMTLGTILKFYTIKIFSICIKHVLVLYVNIILESV